MIRQYVVLPTGVGMVIDVGAHVATLSHDVIAVTCFCRACQSAQANPTSPNVQPDESWGLTKEEQALGLLIAHPEWTNTQLAKALCISRTTLYGWTKFQLARAWLKGLKERLPRGSKTNDGRLEAYVRDDQVEEN